MSADGANTWARGARRARQAIVTVQEEADCIALTCQSNYRAAHQLHRDETPLHIDGDRRSPSPVRHRHYNLRESSLKGLQKVQSQDLETMAICIRGSETTLLRHGVTNVNTESFT
jgi:hypothetical protein